MDLILTIALIHLVACLSPGPDIFLVVLNSLRHGWRTGVATTAGILTGVTLHITLGIAGISYLITRSERWELAIGLAGGAWLLYLGGRGILSAGKVVTDATRRERINQPAASFSAAWTQGLLVNLLNPKALLYFLSLFSVMLGPDIRLTTKIASGATLLGVQALAFSTVAILMDRPQFKDQWLRTQIWLDRAISLIFIALGLWIWTSSLYSIAS